MNCPFASQADDYIDGALSRTATSAFDGHLPGCQSCPQLLADLRAIRATAMSLERHIPPSAVWSRIEQHVQPRRRWYAGILSSPRRTWVPAAAGAFALALVVGLVTWTAFGRYPVSAPAAVSAGNGPRPDPASQPESVDAELTLAQQHYERAITGLEQITASEGAALDAQTSAELQKNVSVIDQAISESRAALQTQPASVVAQESLFDALRSKVALLQDTVSLINEMRKGDTDGAARIISGLNK